MNKLMRFIAENIFVLLFYIVDIVTYITAYIIYENEPLYYILSVYFVFMPIQLVLHFMVLVCFKGLPSAMATIYE